MKKTVTYALLTGTVFLVLFTLSVAKPGLPVTLKADEPAYFLMALSLAHDHDLACELRDYRRLQDAFPFLPTENLILMSDDKGVGFGKPYIYPFLAAPLAGLFGANGLVAFNALLFALMIVLATLYLRRFNSDGQAALFSVAFFLLSPTFLYVFWLHPEILNMASATGCLFFAFHTFESAPPEGRARRCIQFVFNARTAPWWSASSLALGTYSKPVLALLGMPALWVVLRRRGGRGAAAWLAAAVLSMAAIAGGAVLLTGHATPYLGEMVRTGVKVEAPEEMEKVVAEAMSLAAIRSTTGNTWSWIFRLPSADPRALLENVGYFLWGRHTGLLIYFPLVLPCLILFVLHQRRVLSRWICLAAALAVALFFLLFIPFNWHGGGGFIGNRYFVMVYPAFLFLVTSLKPLWMLPGAASLGGLFLGSLLFSPFGAPVRKPTLQAHTRAAPYSYLPLELSLLSTIPGYALLAHPKALFVGRQDLVQTHRPEKRRVWVDAVSRQPIPLVGALDTSVAWIYGATSTTILLMTERPIEGVFFHLASWVPNHIELGLSGDRHVLDFDHGRTPGKSAQVVELRPRRVHRRHYEKGKQFLVYRLIVRPQAGRRVLDRRDPSDIFYLGAQLRYLGRRDQVTQPEHYRISWLTVEAPATAQVGGSLDVRARIRNAGDSTLSSADPLAVNLGYHWQDESGQVIVFGGERSSLPNALVPAAESDVVVRATAPQKPGRYRLVLDAVREHVAWFSERGGETYTVEVEVFDREPASALPK